MNQSILTKAKNCADGTNVVLSRQDRQLICRDYLALRDAVQTLSKFLQERINNCCGKHAGKYFCEAYGCGSMKDIANKLDNAVKT